MLYIAALKPRAVALKPQCYTATQNADRHAQDLRTWLTEALCLFGWKLSEIPVADPGMIWAGEKGLEAVMYLDCLRRFLRQHSQNTSKNSRYHACRKSCLFQLAGLALHKLESSVALFTDRNYVSLCLIKGPACSSCTHQPDRSS